MIYHPIRSTEQWQISPMLTHILATMAQRVKLLFQILQNWNLERETGQWKLGFTQPPSKQVAQV